MEKTYLLDNEIETTLSQIIEANSDDDFPIKEIEQLAIGESCWIQTTFITRIL